MSLITFNFLFTESIKVILNCGLENFRGIPGKPAPVPTSITLSF